MPEVSIIVPTFNRADLLPRALNSALAQTFTDFEVLVIDDGSTDATTSLMEGYQARDSRIKYLVQSENRGVSAARNRGFREARGKYFALLDADDEWMSEKLQRQVAFFKKAPASVGLLYTGIETIGPRHWIERPTHRGELKAQILERNVIHGTSSVMLRREAVEAIGAFDEGIPAIEDWEYWIRLAQQFEIDYLAEPLCRYYDPHDDQLRKSLNKADNFAAREWLYRKHEGLLKRSNKAHVFLMESARRHGNAGREHRDEARYLLWRAFQVKPFNLSIHKAILKVELKRLLPSRMVNP